MVDDIESQKNVTVVFVLQTDGGLDHLIKRLKTKLVMVSITKTLNLDHAFVIRGDPNGLTRNKIGHPITTLQVACSNISTKQKGMAPWAVKAVKKYGSMVEVCVKHAELKLNCLRAIERIKELDRIDKARATRACHVVAFENIIELLDINNEPNTDVSGTR